MNNDIINISGNDCIKLMLEERKKTLLKSVANNDSNINTNVLARLAELEFLYEYLTKYDEYSSHKIHYFTNAMNIAVTLNSNYK